MSTTTTTRNRNVAAYVAEAIEAEMERDEAVVVYGEDVGAMGGVFGATRNLQRRFGEQRVRDTPIAEMGFVGMGVGMAMAGYRPLVEVMFVDFLGVCLEQIYNQMAKIHYMSGGRQRVPMVVKTAGGSIGDAAQHSQSLWGTFAHLPGMRVVVPSCPYDYKGLMAASIACDDPVVFVEHKALLMAKSSDFAHGAEVPEERYTVPLGEAAVVREGGDATVVTLAAGVGQALEAAEKLAADGIEAEVVDLRSLVPLDAETICASVEKTGRLLVVDEDYLSYGLSGEVVARVVERLGPGALGAVERLAVPDVPLPASPVLEGALQPNPETIEAAVRRLTQNEKKR